MKSRSKPEVTEQFETRSLTLAAYLSLQGFEYSIAKVSGDTPRPYGVWRFPDGRDLQRHVSTFQAQEARVEPEAFDNKRAELRREIMELTR